MGEQQFSLSAVTLVALVKGYTAPKQENFEGELRGFNLSCSHSAELWGQLLLWWHLNVGLLPALSSYYLCCNYFAL